MKKNNEEFDEQAWRHVCETAGQNAHRSCGLSHDYYTELFSIAIDQAVLDLPDANRAKAIEIAGEWDYATEAQRAETQLQLSESGCCTHGIELGCCPAGCGS